MEKSWEILEGACYSCKKCRLSEMRTNVVIGKGSRNADIMFIGEGPGQQEDLTGIPFVGPAGQLLDKMLAAVNLSLEDVYVANIVKCRPPGNRDPHDDEKEACLNYLRYQLAMIHPKIIVCLGRIAATTIISPDFKITRQRGAVDRAKRLSHHRHLPPFRIITGRNEKTTGLGRYAGHSEKI